MRGFKSPLLGGGIVMLLGLPAPADGFSDDFNDGVLDPVEWTAVSGAFLFVEETGGVLGLGDNSGSTDAYVKTVRVFYGDFDAQVDFELTTFPFIWTAETRLGVDLVDLPGDDDVVHLVRRRTSSDDVYRLEQRLQSPYTLLAEQNASGDTGRFRIARIGGDIVAYTWNGSWVPLGTGGPYSGSVRVELAVSNGANFPFIHVDFDNFSLVADDFIDCNTNGVHDPDDLASCDGSAWCADCNTNGLLDECDIAGASEDINGNGTPDECEDCNANEIPDPIEHVNCDGSPWCEDCNFNDVLDACDIASGSSADLDGNGVPDTCEDCDGNNLPDGLDSQNCGGSAWCDDCNTNGILDGCDTSSGDSDDFNVDGIPDECQDCNANGWLDPLELEFCDLLPECEDCNHNQVIDSCDIADGGSDDTNTNGIPDECEGIPVPATSAISLGVFVMVLIATGVIVLRSRHTGRRKTARHTRRAATGLCVQDS